MLSYTNFLYPSGHTHAFSVEPCVIITLSSTGEARRDTEEQQEPLGWFNLAASGSHHHQPYFVGLSFLTEL